MRCTLLVLLSLLSLGCSAPTSRLASSPPSPGTQHAAFYDAPSARRVTVPYLVYLPKDYNATQSNCPLVISLHGSGSSGTDIAKLKGGLPSLAASGRDFPFILVSPLCRSKHWFNVDDLDQFLDYVLKTYRVDPDRVYLTGLSLGAYGAWDWAEKRPDRFAALVPIAGGCDPLEADRLKNIPTWAFHGVDDKVVPVNESVRMVHAINKAGGHAKLTLYPNTGHNAWTQAYDTPELFTWMLAQKRQSSTHLEE